MAVIVGNGPTRRRFNLKDFKPYGPIFGCNALFRDFEPDYLIAIDPPMIQEIYATEFPEKRVIVPSIHEQFEPAAFSPFRRRENAGMVAMREAIKRGYDYLVCVGFDFLIDDPHISLGNVYEGTRGYTSEYRATLEDCVNRTVYLDWFAHQNPDVTFLFVFPKDSYPFRSVKAGNIRAQLV